MWIAPPMNWTCPWTFIFSKNFKGSFYVIWCTLFYTHGHFWQKYKTMLGSYIFHMFFILIVNRGYYSYTSLICFQIFYARAKKTWAKRTQLQWTHVVDSSLRANQNKAIIAIIELAIPQVQQKLNKIMRLQGSHRPRWRSKKNIQKWHYNRSP